MMIPIFSCKSTKTQRKSPIKQTSNNIIISKDLYLDTIDTTYTTDGDRVLNYIYKRKP